MIHAIIENRGNTLVIDFPRSIYDLYEKMQSIGILAGPGSVRLTDDEGDDIRVKLYSESETGTHLLRVLNEQNTVADANLLAFVVQNASQDIQAKLEQNIVNDQYASMQAVVDDIRQMTYDSGPIKQAFYCPLVGNIDEGVGDMYTVGNSYLSDYHWAIEDALEQDRAADEQDMAEHFDEDDSVKEKLVSARWSVESYRGRLFGKIECSFKEALTEAEEAILKKWISGQNADGYGEHFEQQPIDTEDGDLFVSFWNESDDYSIMTHDELDEYIENQQGQQFGGM